MVYLGSENVLVAKGIFLKVCIFLHAIVISCINFKGSLAKTRMDFSFSECF